MASCLFLACKSCEEPRRLRDVINCAHMISTPSWRPADRKASETPLLGDEDKSGLSTKESGAIEPTGAEKRAEDSSLSLVLWNPEPPLLDDAYWKTKEKIVEMEQFILRWLSFDVHVSNPHRAVCWILEDVAWEPDVSETNRTKIMPLALRFINQAVFSIELVRKPVLVLACQAVEWGSRESGIALPRDHDAWLAPLGLSRNDNRDQNVT